MLEVLKSLRPPVLPILAVYPGARLVPARVRAFIQALKSMETDPADSPG